MDTFKKSDKILRLAYFFVAFFVIWSFLSIALKQGEKYIIHSDGRGYYAYLPAFFCFQDPTFEKSLKAEQSYHEGLIDQYYIYQVDETHRVDKYFPGVSLLLLPFFLLAYLLSYLLDYPLDGYNSIFQWGYWMACMFYAGLGIVTWLKVIRKLGVTPSKELLYFGLIVAGPTLFYIFFGIASSHVFTFCLFAFLALNWLKFESKTDFKQAIKMGVLLGLIFLVRPTNLIIVLILPLLLYQKHTSILSVIQWIWSIKIHVVTLLISFLFVATYLVICWYIQTGHFFEWSYKGEGFNWLKPKIDEWIWGYRTGLLFHVPFLFVSFFIGFKQVKFNSIWWFYIGYVVLLFWMLSAWWCWNYESGFNIRPLTEHMLFLYLPVLLIAFKKWRGVIYAVLVLNVLLVSIRIVQNQFDWVKDQRFTKTTYWGSLRFWENQKNRWNTTLACTPFGKKIATQAIFSSAIDTVLPNKEYCCSGEIELRMPRTHESNFVVVTCEKKVIESAVPNDLLLVMDAWNSKGTDRSYQCVPFYHDKYEGLNNWTSIRFEAIVPDNFQKFDRLKVYIWNRKKEKLMIRNFKSKVEWYLAD